jgi:ribose transport system substrate-binding protein
MPLIRSRRARRFSLAVAMTAGLFLVAGCSAADDGSRTVEAVEAPNVGSINDYALPEVPDDGELYRAAVFVAHQAQGDAISYVEALEEFGAEHGLSVDLYDAGGYSEIDKQISQIQTAIATDPDIIIIWATDPNAVVPALKQASEAGIKVLNWVQSTGFDGAISSIESDFVTDSYNLTLAMSEMIGGEGDLVTTYGGCGSQYQRDLQEGTQRAVDETPGLKIAVEECPPDFDPSAVQTIVENALASDPDIRGVLASVMSQAVGAVNAVTASAAQGDVVVGAGILTSCEDVALVTSGQIPVALGVPSAYMGRLGAAVALRALSGESVEDEYIVPSNVYTADNIGDADLTMDLVQRFLDEC